MSDVLAIGGLTVGAGEIVALLGGNGAGKTALLETVLGFRPGAVSLFGREVARLPVEQRVALGVGYVPERRRVFAGLTVRENLEAASSLPAAARQRRVEEMLALARAEMNGARLLLLDEPTLGLAPVVVADLFHRLTTLATEGTAILMSEQRAGLALRVASRGAVLSRGRIVRQGTARELLADEKLADLMAGG